MVISLIFINLIEIEVFIYFRILDRNKNECPMCRALVANTRSKLYNQAFVKENEQDMRSMIKDNILSFITKLK